jgi:hypothetical protein
MTNILTAVWSPLEIEKAYDDHLEKHAALHEYYEEISFEDFFLAVAAGLPPAKIRHTAAAEAAMLPSDFDDVELRFFRQFPRKSAGNIGAGDVDGTPVTGKGHRIYRDPS